MKKLFLLSMVLLVSEVQAAQYYFSPTGEDANPGTLARPWRTLDKLAVVKDTLKPGDTIYFRGGNYLITDSTKVDDFAWTAKGTEAARITYKNYLNEKPVIVYDRRNTTGANRIVVQPGSYSTIDGLTFRQTEESRRVAIGAGEAYADYNTYYSKSVRAMYITASNVILRNSTIDNFSSVGLGIRGANAIVEYNTFINSANHIWYVQGPDGIFRYNTLDGGRQMPETGRYGIQIQYVGSHHNKIYGNVIKNTVAGGVIFSGKVSYNEVYNNVFIDAGDNRASGCIVCAWTEDGPVGVGNRFYNNTAIGKTISAVFGGKPAELAKVEIRDNIFYPSNRIPADETETVITRNYTSIKNNIFFNVTGPLPAGNRLVDPQLVNPLGTTDASAMLKSGSPAIDAGMGGIFPATDFRGNRRPAKYDIGAFEFGVGSSKTPKAPTSLQPK